MSSQFTRWENQNIALAAVTQCASLVQSLAVSGQAPQSDLLACINPLMVLNPDSIDAVYPQVPELTRGLRTMQSLLGSERSPENADMVRYILGMLLLRNKLDGDSAMQSTVRDRLARIEPIQAVPEDFQDLDERERLQAAQDRSFRQLAGLYQDPISTLSYRVQVQGKVEHLKDEQVANRIRALLLAGIRSAVLWHQLGGRRWRLLFYRKKIQESAGDIRRKLLSSV